MKRSYTIFIFAMFILIVGACSNSNGTEKNQTEDTAVETTVANEETPLTAHATMINTQGEKVGTAKLEQVDDGVMIFIEASGLTPGLHGFHVHEKGKCDPPDFESAGGHFNPTNKEHGFDNPKGPHAGDLPNIEADEEGYVRAEVLANMVTLEKGKKNSLFKKGGTTLMIHSQLDDYKSQPAGNSGDRVSCGVIEK